MLKSFLVTVLLQTVEAVKLNSFRFVYGEQVSAG